VILTLSNNYSIIYTNRCGAVLASTEGFEKLYCKQVRKTLTLQTFKCKNT